MDDSRVRDWSSGGDDTADHWILFCHQSAHGADAAGIFWHGVLARFYGAGDRGGGLSARDRTREVDLITYLAGKRTSHDAAPMQRAPAGENIAWTGPKYFRQISTPAICTAKKTQPNAPMARGNSRASCPRCQDKNAENNMATLEDSPKPR